MSLKAKLSSNQSTPIKAKGSANSSVSASPVKGNKYKNFLTAVLTPSQTKKWLKRKKSNKSDGSFKGSKTEIEGIYKGSQISDDFNEPAYSSIEELQLKQASCQESVIYSDSALSSKVSENVRESSSQILSHRETGSVNVDGEPLYSTVNKQKKLKNIHAGTEKKDDFHDLPNEEIHANAKYLPSRLENNENMDSLSKTLVEEQKEEIRLLVERMKELTKENRELRKNIESIIKEEKWKEDSLHAELKLKITQLEADTHKEVKCLSERITTLVKERKVLSDQIHILHEEKRMLQAKCEDFNNQVKSMVSPESMKRIVNENEMLVNEMKKTHLQELKKLQIENEVNLESKIKLMGEVEGLKEKIKILTAKNETLSLSEQELLVEKKRIFLQLEESKQMQQEAQNMLLSLLKMTEALSIERDVLLNKASFQDHQQKLLQSTMMDYSLNMGRLQEHISNISREKLEELQKLKSGESQRDESLKNFYGKQLDLLRSKVLNQSNTINDLQSEKSKLELQLESLWQAACLSKSKPEDVKYSN